VHHRQCALYADVLLSFVSLQISSCVSQA